MPQGEFLPHRGREFRTRSGTTNAGPDHCATVSVVSVLDRGGLMTAQTEKAGFGIEGLDDITAGGLARGRLFLLEGHPGTGKTTIATEFLLEGVQRGEKCLYITLSETEDELRMGARSHGWSLEGIELFEL